MVLAIITVENSSCCLIFLSKQWYMSLWYSLTNKKLQCLNCHFWDFNFFYKQHVLSQLHFYCQICGWYCGSGPHYQQWWDRILDEVERLTSWCQDNCLSLNVSKTKELIVDFRKRQQRPYTPLMISGTPVERVSSFKYLGVNISEDLTWTAHIQTQVKKARQRLYHLR